MPISFRVSVFLLWGCILERAMDHVAYAEPPAELQASCGKTVDDDTTYVWHAVHTSCGQGEE